MVLNNATARRLYLMQLGTLDHPNDSSANGRIGGVLSCADWRWEEHSHR